MVRYPLSLLATATMSISALAQTQFEWVSPLPHRQDWTDMAYGNGKFVGLTDGFGARYLYTSADGETWTRPNAPISNRLNKVTFADGKFVAVGDSGQIAVSTDGATWTVRSGQDTFLDVAFGNGRWVVAANAPKLLSSADLESWTPAAGLGTGYTFEEVEFGNGVFLAVGQYGNWWRSTDGQNWQQVDGSGAADGQLVFSNGRFISSSTLGIATSEDGLSWIALNTSPKFFVAAAPGGFLAHAPNGIEFSADGATWTRAGSISTSFGENVICFAASANKWLLAGGRGLLAESTDGQAWTRSTTPAAPSATQVAFGNGRFVRFSAEPGIRHSTNGADWELVESAPALSALAGGNGVWIGVSADQASVYVSTDLSSWFSVQGLSGPFSKRIVFGGGQFVIGTSAGLATTADGQHWNQPTLAGAGSTIPIGYLNGRFAAMSADRRPITSDDGVTWTIHDGKTVFGGPNFAAGNDRFVSTYGAGMGYGNCSWSLDGINWNVQHIDSGSTHSNDSLAFGNGVFLDTDYYGNIYESRDGLTWQGGRQAPQNFSSTAFGNGTWVVVGGDSVLRSETHRAQSNAVTGRVAVRLETTGQVVLALTGPANTLIQLRQATAIDGEWSNLGSVRLSATGSASYPVNLGQTKGFFSAQIVAE